jgi:hypothetical protein
MYNLNTEQNLPWEDDAENCPEVPESEETDSQKELYRELIACLIDELKDQNLEIISLRYLLSNYMKHPGEVYMRMEILSGLYPLFTDGEEFEYYVCHDCHGDNPFDSRDYRRLLRKAADGLTVQFHPQICTDYLK